MRKNHPSRSSGAKATVGKTFRPWLVKGMKSYLRSLIGILRSSRMGIPNLTYQCDGLEQIYFFSMALSEFLWKIIWIFQSGWSGNIVFLCWDFLVKDLSALLCGARPWSLGWQLWSSNFEKDQEEFGLAKSNSCVFFSGIQGVPSH